MDWISEKLVGRYAASDLSQVWGEKVVWRPDWKLTGSVFPRFWIGHRLRGRSINFSGQVHQKTPQSLASLSIAPCEQHPPTESVLHDLRPEKLLASRLARRLVLRAPASAG